MIFREYYTESDSPGAAETGREETGTCPA